MSSLDDIANIIQSGFVGASGLETKNVEVYNVNQLAPGTYTYDASVYFPATQNAESNVFYEAIDDSSIFNALLQTKIVEKNPTLSVTSAVDTTSERFTRSLNKGKSRPKFDRIVPTIDTDSFQVQLGTPDYIEIADVSCVKSSTNVTTSFTINTNLSNEKVYWYVKLANQDLSNATDFENFLKVTAPSQKQNSVTLGPTGTSTITNKAISQTYSATDTLVAFDANSAVHYVYVFVYFNNFPDFNATYTQIIN
jgi:hypothetical protein